MKKLEAAMEGRIMQMRSEVASINRVKCALIFAVVKD